MENLQKKLKKFVSLVLDLSQGFFESFALVSKAVSSTPPLIITIFQGSVLTDFSSKYSLVDIRG